jgi:hypothetical protein
MPRCPECGKEIDELICIAEEIHEYTFQFDDKEPDDVRYEETDMWAGDWQIWKCPLCDAELFHSQKEEKEFLKCKAKQATLQ